MSSASNADWLQVSVGKVADVTSGKRPPVVSVAPLSDSQIPVFGGSGVTGYTREALFTEPVLVTGRVGTLGLLQKVTEPSWPSDNTLVIRPNPKVVEFRYLGYCLDLLIGRLAAFNRGTSNPLIVQQDIKRLELALPSLAEQRAIEHILGTLDDKIELNRRMNETLEAMARAIFKSWFVDFDPVRAKAEGRDPGLPKPLADLFPDSIDDSELKEIPKGWQVVTVADLADINARTLGRSDPLDVIDYIEISEVMHGEVANIVRYKRGTEPSRARRRLAHGDTVLSTVRPDRGAHFLCLNPPETLVASTGFAVVSPRDGDWAFLYTALTNREVGEKLGRLADGGAYPAVRHEAIASLRLPLPTAPQIRSQFEALARPLFERSAHNRTESIALASIRDTLLPKLISGERRIKDAERFLHPRGTQRTEG